MISSGHYFRKYVLFLNQKIDFTQTHKVPIYLERNIIHKIYLVMNGDFGQPNPHHMGAVFICHHHHQYGAHCAVLVSLALSTTTPCCSRGGASFLLLDVPRIAPPAAVPLFAMLSSLVYIYAFVDIRRFAWYLLIKTMQLYIMYVYKMHC